MGLNTDAYGTNFEWFQGDRPDQKGFTQWSPFPKESDYFGNQDQEMMINYRVEDLDGLIGLLKAEGVQIVDDIVEESYGKFVHIVDCDGNRIELWEPNDQEYDKIVEGRTK